MPVLRIRRLPLAILLVGVMLFAGLSAACLRLYDGSEDRLLQQRTNEAGLILTSTAATLRAPLDVAAQVASVSDGDPGAFEAVATPSVGEGKPFSSVVLYRIGDDAAIATIDTIGVPSELERRTEAADDLVARAMDQPFVIADLLDGDTRRLGYAVNDASDGRPAEFVVYGERTLPADPNVRRQTSAPFAGLDYAVYLGAEPRADALLGSSVTSLPITGRSASVTLEFGDTSLLLVMTPSGQLSGWLFSSLWWIVLAVGGFVTVAFAALTQRLLDRRDTAMRLAGENRRLFDEQRQIAESLQISLLPQHLAAPRGAEVVARYWPAGPASLIGGDFYDSFRVAPQRWAITIGDVCGKGIEAAGLTGMARHTIRAASRHETTPSAVLRSVHVALGDQVPATFCTACMVFTDGATVDLSLGGHPQPLLRRSSGEVELVGTPGTLLGIVEPRLTDVRFSVEPGDTLVLYTDGLTDAPGEQAVPIEHLVDVVGRAGADSIEALAEEIRLLKRSHRPSGSSDDTALLIVRFGTT